MGNVLVACEESQVVCTAFRNRGHNAFSCDLLPCSGGHPEWHIQGDVLKYLNPQFYESDLSFGFHFCTADGSSHFIPGKWDLIIAHPPCTYLTVTGNRWFDVSRYGEKARQRLIARSSAIAFFMHFVFADCERVCIENPVGVMSTAYMKPSQIIQPYFFGDAFEKRTCLWLRGLPDLIPCNVVSPPPRSVFKSGSSLPTWYAYSPKKNRAAYRSKTFPGFAVAMAEQWGARL